MEEKNIELRPKIIRESEFFGGCIRVKISVKNNSSLAIMDAALELENDENILHCDRCEPKYPEKKGKILLGNINPGTDRTIAFYLDPLICAKEGTDINCRIFYKDAYGRSEMVQMEPLKIKVICPIFRTEQEINIGRLKELIAELQFRDSKVYMFPKKVELQEILRSCRDVIQFHDVRHIKTFKTTDEKTYESWYYGKTKVTKKDLVIKCAIRKETESIEVLASGNDPGDITGLLAELGRNLTKEFEKMGKVQPVFNITIKDSVIQRSNLLSFCNLDGSCGGNVVIEDSVVQRSNIASWNNGERERREKKEERDRMEEEQRLRDEAERRRIEEEQRREKQEKYEAFLLKQKREDEYRKAKEEKEKRAEVERREREKQKAIQEEDRPRRQREEAARIQREKEDKRARIEQVEKSSGGKWFYAVIIIFGLLALGYWVLAPGMTDSTSASSPKSTSSAPTYFPSQNNAPKIILNFSSSDTLDINTVNFSHKNWGKYQVVYFNGEKYFAGYQKGEISDKDITLLDSDLLSRVFIDNGSKKVISEGGTLTLEDGYNIRVDSIDVSTGKIQFVLLKDRNKVYNTTADASGTYVYSKNVGNINNVPIIAIQFGSVFRGREATAGFIEGLFQISETPIGIRRVFSETSTFSSTPLAALASDQKSFTNSIGMEFVLISAGEFDMGSPAGEKDRYSTEGPVHRVKISNAFYMGKYEITQKQWRDIMGNSPSYFNGDNLPVEQVSWNDVQEFVKKLNEKEGGNKYRLPSEAEWEYSARAGTTTRYSFGDDELKLGDYAWYEANSNRKTHPVGQKKPNPWGLYDMHGNVWEWVQDKWYIDYNDAPTDGGAWEDNGSDRVYRGGEMFDNAGFCRSASRNGGVPSGHSSILGFRLLRIS